MCSRPDTMYAHGLFVIYLIAGYRTGIICSEIITNDSLVTRKEAFAFCKTRGGSLLKSTTSDQPEVGESRVWTSDVIKLTDNQQRDCANATKLCGFIHLLHGKNKWKGDLFGDCQAKRSYACRNSSGMPFVTLNATYSEAIQCHNGPTGYEIRNLSSGYYWIPETKSYCQQQQHTDLSLTNDSASNYLCEVYSKDFGQAYFNCSGRLSVACLLDSPETTIGVVPTFSTQNRHTRTGYSRATEKIVSPVQFHTKTKELSTGKHTVTTQDTSTEKSLSPVQPHTTNRESNTAKHSGIGVKIGVPIAVSIVIVCGVILSIVFIRRRHRKRSNQNNRMSRQIENQTTSGKAVKSQNNQYVYNYHNRRYDDNAIKKQTAVENTVYNEQQGPENNQQPGDNNDYCFASDYDQESELHVYDHTNQIDEQYDTITSKRKKGQDENMTENVYNHLGSDELDDVYNSTKPVKLQRGQESDNVYNKLPSDSSVDDTQYSRLNYNPRKHKIQEENTYNTT